uniref:Uncharacterized protein n=1 Tax=Anguilla anguilla TaxID=7936 RepID=A0A0E9T608_ANGAN
MKQTKIIKKSAGLKIPTLEQMLLGRPVPQQNINLPLRQLCLH